MELAEVQVQLSGEIALANDLKNQIETYKGKIQLVEQEAQQKISELQNNVVETEERRKGAESLLKQTQQAMEIQGIKIKELEGTVAKQTEMMQMAEKKYAETLQIGRGIVAEQNRQLSNARDIVQNLAQENSTNRQVAANAQYLLNQTSEALSAAQISEFATKNIANLTAEQYRQLQDYAMHQEMEMMRKENQIMTSEFLLSQQNQTINEMAQYSIAQVQALDLERQMLKQKLDGAYAQMFDLENALASKDILIQQLRRNIPKISSGPIITEPQDDREIAKVMNTSRRPKGKGRIHK
ncbi:MAG: hypothetical protein B7Z80_00950 [Rhodospirillales bacterium 20-64-7]|nr:MAG: hypothetical protein B7Z80_00950 [Rhodospirillales bacterium 20-64-7]